MIIYSISKQKIKDFKVQITEIKDSLEALYKINFNTDKLSSNQIKLLNPEELGGIDQLQSYIDKINDISRKNLFDFAGEGNQDSIGLQAKAYANALQDVGDAQAALLLSTQGVNNSLIQQMLNEKGLETEEQYLTMVEAGLLKSKQSLEYAELQNIIATQVGNEEYVEAIMNHMRLSTVINKEGIATTKLTSKKLQELVTSGLLTEAQAQKKNIKKALYELHF